MLQILKKKTGAIIVEASLCIGVFLLAFSSILGLILETGREAIDFHQLAQKSQGLTSIYAAEGIHEECVHYLSSETHTIAYKAFSGIKDGEGDRLVFIFPKSGIRYHIAGCPTLNPGDTECILTDAVRQKYEPCKICKPDNLPAGASVFLYSDVSKIYHKKNCATITKSYDKISVSEAIKRGYTACKRCLPDLNRSSEESGK